MATYLDVVNNVLKRLREPTVTSVTDTDYSTLVGIWVNDAKREIEDAHDWNALNSTIVVTTVANTRNYTLTGSGQRFTTSDVLNDTDDFQMRPANRDWINRMYYLGTTTPASPTYYAYNGVDSSGDTKVDVYPKPDGVYSLRFELTIPTVDLVNDSDSVLIPSHLPSLLAYSKAIAERGEDSGVTSSEAYLMYRLALADAIAIEKNRYEDTTVWSAV
jgi:hypothetical protein